MYIWLIIHTLWIYIYIDITCINYKDLCKTPKGYSSLNIYIFFPLLPNIESSPSGDLYGFLRGLRRCPGGQSCHLSSLKSNFSFSFRQFLWNVRFFFSTNKNGQKGCCLKKDVFVFLHFFPLGFENHYLDEVFVLRMVFVVSLQAHGTVLKLANAEWKKSRIHIIGIASKLHHPSVNNSYLTVPGKIESDTIHVCLTSDDADLRSAAVVVRSVSLAGQTKQERWREVSQWTNGNAVQQSATLWASCRYIIIILVLYCI